MLYGSYRADSTRYIPLYSHYDLGMPMLDRKEEYDMECYASDAFSTLSINWRLVGVRQQDGIRSRYLPY